MKLNQLVILPLIFSAAVWGGARENAYVMFNRFTGTPPRAAVLDTMAEHIENNEPEKAAYVAMEDQNFYNLVVKSWAASKTNTDQSPRVPLNDYIATMIGMIRDDLPFNQILTADVIYTLDQPSQEFNTNGQLNELRTHAYSKENNDHYVYAEMNPLNIGLNLSEKLVRRTQSELNGIDTEATSGVMTTRASGEAYFQAGTGRRPLLYTFINFLCKGYEEISDITRPDTYVRRDVERNPGGDSRTYKTTCIGCHAGGDGMSNAYANYDWDGRALTYNMGTVAPKINKIINYPSGYEVTNDYWTNIWATGKNQELGWPENTTGVGAKSLNTMISESRQFALCMAQQVYQILCIKSPITEEETAFVRRMAEDFRSERTIDGITRKYSMKDLFAKTASESGCLTNE